MLDKNRKSVAVRWHNKGRTLKAIADRTGDSIAEIEAFLKSRPGYPGAIVSPTAKYEKDRRPGGSRERVRTSPTKARGTGVYAGDRNAPPAAPAEEKKRGPSGARPVTLARITLLEEKSVLER